jgi:hypothetical protein
LLMCTALSSKAWKLKVLVGRRSNGCMSLSAYAPFEWVNRCELCFDIQRFYHTSLWITSIRL